MTARVNYFKMRYEEGFFDTLLALAKRTFSKSEKQEEGTRLMVMAQDQIDEAIVYFFEIYADEAAYQVHLASEQYTYYKEHAAGHLEVLDRQELDWLEGKVPQVLEGLAISSNQAKEGQAIFSNANQDLFVSLNPEEATALPLQYFSKF